MIRLIAGWLAISWLRATISASRTSPAVTANSAEGEKLVANERPSQVYAQAVFEKAMANWLTPLKTIAASLARSGSIEKLDDAGLAFPKKQELLHAVFPKDASPEVENFLFLLASKNEAHLLPEIIKEFDRYAERTSTSSVARVTTAVSLTSGEKQSLETKLRNQFGDQIVFDYVVDPAILGGVIVRVGDKEIDGSVSGKFAALEEKLES
jgi:F-type H+-transporting ATPase subunit delta